VHELLKNTEKRNESLMKMREQEIEYTKRIEEIQYQYTNELKELRERNMQLEVFLMIRVGYGEFIACR